MNCKRGARERAAVSAINKTLAKAKTNMIRAISREYNVSAGYVRERLRVEAATYRRGAAQIYGTLNGSGERGRKRSANVIAFLEKSVTSWRRRRKARRPATLSQLHFQIKRGSSRVVIPGAFIGNKGRTVFQRVGKERACRSCPCRRSMCRRCSTRSGSMRLSCAPFRMTSLASSTTRCSSTPTASRAARGAGLLGSASSVARFVA
jgi:hypothetical protein